MARLAPYIIPLALAMSGCAPGSRAAPAGGPPLALDVLEPPGTQLGLHYGTSVELRVRYRTDDEARVPLGGRVVRFSIFSDPAGSTLARDRALTDRDGVAVVTLTAGQAEATFRVVAEATNAPEAEIDVSISKLDFVELGVDLAWPAGDAATTTLRALMYDDRTCAALPAAASQPAPFRALASANTTQTTLFFHSLLSQRYALVGRAEGAKGRLVGYGCLDLPAALLPPGSESTVPLPLVAVPLSPLGQYAIHSQLHPTAALAQAVRSPWQTFGTCPYGAAQLLLDAMGVSEQRAPAPAPDGCRPVSANTLDQQLQDLLAAPPMAPVALLPAAVRDLEAITGTVELDSRLTIRPSGPSSFVGEHALGRAGFGVAGHTQSYDLVALGLPVIDVPEVPVRSDGTTLTVARHEFTFGWTTLWKQAFIDLSLTGHFPGLGEDPFLGLVQRVVAPATRNGKTGCAALDDLAKSASPKSSCVDSLTNVAAALAAPFAAAPGVDLAPEGVVGMVDPDGDLQTDTLTGGVWSAPQLDERPGANSFSGSRL